MTDVLARDAAGTCYNVEIQVRRYDAWSRRGLYYLTRVLVQQLGAGEDYAALGAVVATETARGLIQLGVLGDGQIARVTGLSPEEIAALRSGDPH